MRFDVIIRERVPDKGRVRVAQLVNRDLDHISFRGAHAGRNFHQVLELGSHRWTNTLTSISKDNYLWIALEI